LSIASCMLVTIVFQAPTGSLAWPPMIWTCVVPQNCHIAPISGIDGIGAPVAPASLKPARISSSTLAAETLRAGRRPPSS